MFFARHSCIVFYKFCFNILLTNRKKERTMTTFHERLRRAREKADKTQEEVGRAVGVTPQAVQHWERDTQPRGHRLQLVAQFLNTTVNYLVSGTEPAGEVTHTADTAATYITSNTMSELPIIEYTAAVSKPRKIKEQVHTIGIVGTTLPHSEYAFAIINPNNNMSDKYDGIPLNRGDILIVEPCIEPIDGELVFACINEERKNGIIAQLQINPSSGDNYLYLTGKTTQSPNPFKMPAGSFVIGTITERKTRTIDVGTLHNRLKFKWVENITN